MGDDDQDAVFALISNRFHDWAFCFVVQRGCRLIENQNGCIRQQCTRNAHSFFLSIRKGYCLAAHDRIQAFRELFNQLIQLQQAQCFDNFIVGVICTGKKQIIPYRACQKFRALACNRNLLAEAAFIVTFNVVSIDFDLTRCWFFKSQQQFEQRCLA